jgi:hypothetical protein
VIAPVLLLLTALMPVASVRLDRAFTTHQPMISTVLVG